MPERKKTTHILVVDDEASLRDVISQVLMEDSHEVATADSGERALEMIRKTSYPLVITDIRMGGMDGISLLQEIKLINQDIIVIIMTSHASLDTAVTALRAGVYDYLIKPFEDLTLISKVVERAAENLHLRRENRELIERLKHQNEYLARANRFLKDLAVRDGLTGLYNHRYFHESLIRELTRSQRHGHVFSLLFMDIDFFKRYNDTYGHLEGDRLLRTMADIFRKQLRVSDTTARYGGEEFVMLLPETDKTSALVAAENIRKLVEEHPFPLQNGQGSSRVTISIGIASYPADGNDAHTLVKQADAYLYQAKHRGKNTVCHSDSPAVISVSKQAR